MAALRYATRRLADRALQRLKAVYTASAVKEGAQRRLLRTVVPTSSRRAASSGAAAAKPPPKNTTELPLAKPAAQPQLDEKTKERLVRAHLAKKQRKKEEIFGLIVELDTKLPDRCTKVNKQLAIDLSAQVEPPKPGVPQWRWYRGLKRANTFLLYSLIMYLGYMAVSNGCQNCDVQTHAKDPTEQE